MCILKRVRENRDVLRSRILDYASNAFSINGIKDVTMDSIAGGLSISKRTLYEIFNDKEELLLEIIKAHSQETREFISYILKDSDNILDIIFKIYERNSEEIKKVNRAFFEEMHKYPTVVKFLQYARDEMASLTMYCFHKGIEQGLFREDVNYEIIRIAMIEEIDMLMKSKLNEKYSLVEIYENVVFMHMRGVSTEKGMKKVDEFFCKLKNNNN